jgi:hypothetical protein
MDQESAEMFKEIMKHVYALDARVESLEDEDYEVRIKKLESELAIAKQMTIALADRLALIS